jgi:sulfhydrogenase subunit beta (sulfur reductase)
MTTIVHIDKENWESGITASQSRYRLAGPVKNHTSHIFRELRTYEMPDMDYRQTRLSPKSLLFPQSEIMFTFAWPQNPANADGLEDAPWNERPCAIIGIQPYDAKAAQIMKLNFDTADYPDPYWLRAFNQCTFIGLAVNHPESTDFSTSCGSGPFDETGLDVLLVDCANHYLAKILTDKGHMWMSAAGFSTPAADSALDRIEEMRKAAESQIVSKIATDRLRNLPIPVLYQASFWEEASFGCIHCGACTFACPTCWCFDIQDETGADGGIRMRNWDTCMTSLFTRHASGHNPRATGLSRTRQRFMHKLKYFLDKYDQGIMCVGCGRCIVQCPANIDIREICEKMNGIEVEKGVCQCS